MFLFREEGAPFADVDNCHGLFWSCRNRLQILNRSNYNYKLHNLYVKLKKKSMFFIQNFLSLATERYIDVAEPSEQNVWLLYTNE